MWSDEQCAFAFLLFSIGVLGTMTIWIDHFTEKHKNKDRDDD